MADRDELLVAEARNTMERQLAVIDGINDKAHRLLRAVLVVMGLLVTATGLAIRSEHGALLVRFVTVNGVAGVASLLVATGAAVVTYDDRRFPLGLSREGLQDALALDGDELPGAVVRSYGVATRRLADVNRRDGAWLAVTNVLLVAAIVFATGGLLVGVLDAGTALAGWHIVLIDGTLFTANLAVLAVVATALQIDRTVIHAVGQDMNPFDSGSIEARQTRILQENDPGARDGVGNGQKDGK